MMRFGSVVASLAVMAGTALAIPFEIALDADGNKYLRKLNPLHPVNGARALFYEAETSRQSKRVLFDGGKSERKKEKRKSKRKNERKKRKEERKKAKKAAKEGAKEYEQYSYPPLREQDYPPAEYYPPGEYYPPSLPPHPGDVPINPPPYHDCFSIHLLAAVDEVLKYSSEGPYGTTSWFPLYDGDTYKPVGTYSEQSITMKHTGDCVTSGVFNFDYNENTDSFDSSITVSSSCSSSYGTVTGGTGYYACATGFQVYYEGPNIHFVGTELYVCYAPCLPGPYYGYDGRVKMYSEPGDQDGIQDTGETSVNTYSEPADPEGGAQ